MEIQDLIKEILSPKCKPVYIVSSEELFFIDKLVQTILDKLLAKEFQEFNQSIIYGKDADASSIMDLAREFPFFGDRKIIVVKDAQDIKKAKDSKESKEWDPLISYAKNPLSSTLLIICFSKKPDGRLSWVKQIKELNYFYEFKSLSDYQLPSFIKSVAKDLHLEMDDESQLILLDSIGNDLSTMYNELEKLKLIIPQGSKITKEDINKYIGISKEYNVFELQKAISLKDRKKIFLISKNMSQHAKSNPIIATIGALFNHFQRIWITKVYNTLSDDELNKYLKLVFKGYIKEYRAAALKYSLASIEQAISLLKEYDLKSKGMYHRNISEQDLYIELALKLNQL